MAHKTFGFTVDFNNKKRLAVANVKQNDSAVFNILLVEDGKPVDLTNQQIRLFINKPDNKLVVQDDNITVVDAKRGSIRINVKNSAFQAVGTAVAELDVWGTNQENASSQNFFIEVDEQLGSNDAVKSYVDVNLFRQLTEYIDTANANIAKYRAVMEAFTKAGISAQGLLDIKAYIDNNLASLKAQGDRADNLIPQLNSKNSLADSLIKSLNNTISSGENKKQELINTTNQAEAKKQEVINVTNQAEAKKQDVINYTNNAEAKRAELANTTATAEAKRVEVVNATNTGNNTKTALDKATATAEAKRQEVITATNTANTKIPALEKIIAEADTQGIMLKGTVPASRDCNDFKDFNRWIAWDTGVGDFKNTPEGTLAQGTARVFMVANKGYSSTRFQQEFINVYNSNCITRFIRNYNGTSWGAWYKVYDEANKPTPEEIGACDLSIKSLQFSTRKCFNVGGDSNKYYPVLIKLGNDTSTYGAVKISISRGYCATAPESWGTDAEHKGGLTFSVLMTGDYYWGGNDQEIQVLRFSESYSKMVAGMQMSTDGLVVWLRGGGANYWLTSDYGQASTVTVHLEKFTDIAKHEFDIRTDCSKVVKEVLPFYSHRYGNLYDRNLRVYSPNNKPTPADIGAKPSEPTTFELFPKYIAVRTNGRKPEQYYEFWDIESGWADIKCKNLYAGNGQFLVYHAGNKPTPADIGALSSNGGSLHGDISIDAGKTIITANNYGIAGRVEDGSSFDYLIYMARDNRIKISYHNRPVDIQAKDVTVNGVQVATDIQKNPLWTGCYYVTDTQTVTPSKPLSQCRGGWMLVWSDFNGKLNDTNCVYTYIPKYGYIPFPNETDMLIPISAFDAPIVKALRIADTYFTGYGSNSEGNKGNVALRAVYEY